MPEDIYFCGIFSIQECDNNTVIVGLISFLAILSSRPKDREEEREGKEDEFSQILYIEGSN